MKLELNTAGAWKVVLRGLAAGPDLEAAKEAAHTLARIDAELHRRPLTWRLVSEATERAVAHCGPEGWVQRDGLEFSAAEQRPEVLGGSIAARANV